MLNKAIFAVGAVALTTLVGCESNPRVGQTATVEHGIVRNAQPVTLNSTAGQGALIGGTLGLLVGRGSGIGAAGGAITGAALGGVAGGVAGGDRTGMQFTVEIPGRPLTRIVTDQRDIRVGDCVALEQVGQGANIRRVSQRYCDPANGPAVT